MPAHTKNKKKSKAKPKPITTTYTLRSGDTSKITKALLLSVSLLGGISLSLALLHDKLNAESNELHALAGWANRHDISLKRAILGVASGLKDAAILNMSTLRRIRGKLSSMTDTVVPPLDPRKMDTTV